jgi:GGDEF domain-containing protein
MKKMDTRSEGMYSNDVFQVLFEYEISRARRYPSPVALIEIEMKSVVSNEEALRDAPVIFMNTLNHHLRSVDIPSKKGNSFRVMLPTTNEAGARAVCERLLSVFKNKFDTSDGYSIAFSLHIGGSSHDGGAALSSAELLQKAGEALKQSKLKGPNTYVMLV